MATQSLSQTQNSSLIQRLLQLDGTLEMVLGAALLVSSETVADWFGISSGLVIAGGIFAFAYAAFLFYSAAVGTRRTAWVVALLNFDCAILIAIGMVVAWGDLSTDAKWTLGIVADICLMLSIAQMYALRRSQ